jgi:hypothetical protein
MYYRGPQVDSKEPRAWGESGLRGRTWTLLGITGVRRVGPEPTWKEVLFAPVDVLWRPHMFLILLFEVGHHICLPISASDCLQRRHSSGSA